MKAKTKRRVLHVLTKKKLVKKKTSRHVLRTFLIGLATISIGSMAYAITLNKPHINVAVHSSGPGGVELSAPVVTTPTPNVTSSTIGRGSWYALGLPQPDALTCASRTFPRGSYLRVRNTSNNRVVICRVNDYGPAAWTNRIVDLSRGSFSQVDNLGRGTIPVEISVASGPEGYGGPDSTDYAALVGYSLCQSTHDDHYCETHRQD